MDVVETENSDYASARMTVIDVAKSKTSDYTTAQMIAT
jgi:hypothetical protein